MSDVKRYDMSGFGDGMVEREDGAFYHMDDYDALAQQLAASEARVAELEALLDTPHTNDWFEGVRLEAGHQIKRWGSEHDAGKNPLDWFWLIGFLAQKAATSQIAGDENKARHHTISTGAALLNWFRAIAGDSTSMRPGIDAFLSPAEDKENG